MQSGEKLIKNNSMNVVVSGAGVVTPIGIGMNAFGKSLLSGHSNFNKIKVDHLGVSHFYPAAVVNDFDFKSEIEKLAINDAIKKQARQFRNLSAACMHATCASIEAWSNSGLFESNTNPAKTAIICSGSNIQQDTIYNTQQRYREKINLINPTYGFAFMDTDIIGVISELLNIQGEGYSVGAASASGNKALIEGFRLIAREEYDVVLVVAPCMELSVYEYQGFTALGAMAIPGPDTDMQRLCNPFDEKHCGFVYGQNTGAVVLESEDHARKRGAPVLTKLVAYGLSMDCNRNPNPSVKGEATAMKNALKMGNVSVDDINYINAHGTASVIGDKTEAEAILVAGLQNAKINATKALIGHGISSAGVIEAIACIVQMNNNILHPNPNLETPVNDKLNWVKNHPMSFRISWCMSNSFGFGGINTSIIFQNIN